MALKDNKSRPNDEAQSWLGWVKFLFLVLFTAILFLLGQSMVRHHFFAGGALNNGGSESRP